jgi:hypothetical protein
MMSPKEDPLSGEHDKELSPLPGAPFIHHTPPPPRLQSGMTDRQKHNALRKMKYNEKRAAEGLESAQKQIEKIQKNNEEGKVFGSVEDTLRRIAVKFFDYHPTDIEIEQVRSYIRKRVDGKLDMSMDAAIDAFYALSKAEPDSENGKRFEQEKADFLASRKA